MKASSSNRRKGLRLFPKLTLAFFIFAIAISLAFALSLLIAGLYATGNDLSGIMPESLVDETGELKSLDSVYRVGGWVEKLDDTFQVSQVYGNKKTPQMAYSTDEILQLTSPMDRGTGDYFAFTYPYQSDNGSGNYLLIYDRDNLLLQSSLNISNTNTDTSWGKVFFGVFILLFALISLIMSYVLVRQIKRPLEALGQGMKEVEAGADSVRLDFKASPDLLELRDSFNTMISQLEAQKEDKARLEDKKNRLLLELSHDLRTPLATIKSFATALSEDVVPEAERERYYRTISEKADRVSVLASDLFGMLRMEDSNSLLDLKTLELNEYLRRLGAMYYPEIERTGKDFLLELPESDLFVSADASLLERALTNLLSNAIKYNRTGTKICLKAQAATDHVIIEVADDGQPIPQEEIATLFDPFRRIDPVRSSSEGTGLGLSISQAIAKKHGGTLSYSYHSGYNRFTLTLPQ